MLELNKVMVVGNLTRDPELSYLPSGTALAKLGVAVNRRFKGRDGESREETSFLDVEAWGASAEFCSKWLKKGRRVYVEGRLKQDRWDAPDGSKRSKIVISADRIQFADSRNDGGGGDGGPDEAADGGAEEQRPARAQSPAAPRAPRQSAPPAFPDANPGNEGETDDDLPF